MSRRGEGSIRQRPSGSWEARYRLQDGRQRSIVAPTRREAAERLTEAMAERDQGLRPLDQRLTVGAYMTEWLDLYAAPKVRTSTLSSYRSLTKLYIVPSIGRMPLAQLQPEHVQRMLATIGAQGRRGPLSVTTVFYTFAVLRIALNRALRLGKVRLNVATMVDPPARIRQEMVPMTVEQARQLLASVRGDVLEPLYRLAIATGMRQGEMLALRWSDHDLAAGEVTIRHTLQRGSRLLAEPKTERSRRTVALDPATVELLVAHRSRQPVTPIAGAYVFATPAGRPLDARNVLRRYHRALEAAGLPRQPFHGLRHACATMLLEAGEELANVSRVLGHANLSTTADLYAHHTPALARRAADRMGAVLAG